MSQTQPSANNALPDFFKPLTGETATSAANPENSGANSATAVPPTSAAESAPANGTVDQNTVFSSLGHTAVGGNPGTGPNGTNGTTPGTPQATVSLGGMMQAELVVNLMDAIVPAAIVAGFYAAGVKLRKSQFQLTQSEKNTIAPVMQKCLDSMMLNFDNPWNALAITLVVIYGSKAAEFGLVAWIDKKTEKKESEALQEKIKAADKAANPATYDPSNQSAIDLQEGQIMGEYEPSDEEIRMGVKLWKCSRDKAKARLIKQKGLH